MYSWSEDTSDWYGSIDSIAKPAAGSSSRSRSSSA